MVHNEYARPSGEEHAVWAIGHLLDERGHDVRWWTKSSSEIGNSAARKLYAFGSGIHNGRARREMAALLDNEKIDIVQVQNVYPLFSPSILKPVRQRRIGLVMRCPNYRLFCPTGLHLSNGTICEKCLGGNEWWCALKNCAHSLPKSLGYATRNWVARWKRSFLDNVDVFLVQSEFQKRRFIDGGIPADQIAILPNFARTKDTNDQHVPGEAVSFVGRPAPEKGFDQFLEAARMLPGIPFAAACDTSALNWLSGEIPSNVKLHGFLTGTSLSRFYDHSRMLVIPSQWYEGFPNVALDAMVHCKPVVASRIGALPEIIQHGRTGLLYNHPSVDDLVDKIRCLYHDVDLCRSMGQQGQLRVRTEYSPDVVYTRLTAAYRSAMRRHISGPRDSAEAVLPHSPNPKCQMAGHEAS